MSTWEEKFNELQSQHESMQNQLQDKFNSLQNEYESTVSSLQKELEEYKRDKTTPDQIHHGISFT